MKLTAKERVVKARIKLQQSAYFIYSILFYSQYRMDENIPTAAADIKGNMLFSPKFVESLDEEELKGVMHHETTHIALMHPMQMQSRQPMVFNIAADIVANIYTRESGHTLPRGSLECNYRGTFEIIINNTDIVIEDCRGKSAVVIYDEIMKQLHDADEDPGECGEGDTGGEGERGNPTGDHNWDEIFEGFVDEDGNPVEGQKGVAEEAVGEIGKELKDRIRNAYSATKARGDMPGGLERAIGQIFDSKLNWRWLVERAIVASLPYDTSWDRPSKKSFATGVYMPHVVKEGAEVIVSLDTSYSMMGQDDLNDSISEVVGMALQCRNIDMKIVICDAVIHRIYHVSNGSIEKIKAITMEGGGGTSHRPVYEWVEKNHPDCKLLINITDGWSDFPESSSIPSLWVLTKNSCSADYIPFGQVVKMYK